MEGMCWFRCTKACVSIFLPCVYLFIQNVVCRLFAFPLFWCVAGETFLFRLPSLWASQWARTDRNQSVLLALLVILTPLEEPPFLVSPQGKNIIHSVGERQRKDTWACRPPPTHLNSLEASVHWSFTNPHHANGTLILSRVCHTHASLLYLCNLLNPLWIHPRTRLILCVCVFPWSSTVWTREGASLLGCSGEGNTGCCTETPPS